MPKDFFTKSKCDRCGGPLPVRTMSRFNRDVICLECQKKEKAHPDYQRACDAELEQVRMGNYNFEGIGKPADL